MSNWRDPNPSDYELPSRKKIFEEQPLDENREKIKSLSLFSIAQKISLFLLVIYLGFGIHSVKSDVTKLATKIDSVYPVKENSEPLTREDINRLFAQHRLNSFPNVEKKLLPSSSYIDELLQEGLSEQELNRRFSIMFIIFDEIEAKNIVVSDKKALYNLIERMEDGTKI